ncbi:MAG: AsmA family protein [Rickettsiales bacterium]
MIKIDKEKIHSLAIFLKNRARKIRFYKTKEFKIFTMILFVLIVLTFLLPNFLDNSKLRNDIAEKLSKQTNSKIEIKGSVSVAFLPSPAISINNIFIENFSPIQNPKENDKYYNIYAKNVEIIFPIFGWFSNKLIKKIILNDASIDVFKSDSRGKLEKSIFYTKLDYFNKINPRTPPSRDGISSSLFSVENMESVAKFEGLLPNIQINGGKMTHYDEGKIYSEFINIDATMIYQKTQITGYGRFISDKVENNFEMDLIFNKSSKSKPSYFAIKSPVLDFRLTGTFLEENTNGIIKTKFRGNFNGYITELKNFYKSLFSSSDIIALKLKTNETAVNLTGEIYNDENDINIANIFLESSLLKGVGNIKIDKSAPIFTADIKFDLEKLEIDNIWNTENPAKQIAELAKGVKSDKNSSQQSEIKPENQSQANKDAIPNNPTENKTENKAENPEEKTKDANLANQKTEEKDNIFLNIREYDIDLDINSQTAKLYGGEINDLKLSANISNEDKMMVFPLSFKMASNSEIRIIGNFNQKEHKNKFIGSLDASGDSLYEILEWLDINPKNVKINNLKKFTLFSDVEISNDDFIFKNLYLNLDDKKTEIYGDIDIRDKDSKRMVNSILKFSEFDYEKYISIPINNTYFNEGILSDKILWLNQIYSNYNLKFNFDKLIYDQEIFENQEIKLDFGPGFINIPNNKFASQNNNFNIDFALKINDKTQLLKLKIDAEKLAVDYQKDYFDNLMPVTKTIFDRFFQMPSLQGFEGEIDVAVKNLKIAETPITNFKYFSPISSVTNQAKMEMDIFDGRFDFKGINDIKYNKIINGTFNCRLCNVTKIFKTLYNVDNLGGIANISGNIVGAGKSVYEFKNKLISEISLAVSAPYAKGYGLNDFVKRIYGYKPESNDLQNPEEILHQKTGFTQFLQGKGFVNLKGEKNSNFSISLKSTGINSVFSGVIFLNEESINGTINTIFLAPSKSKQIPINIATNITGYIDDVAMVSNLNQARQYLGMEKIEKSELDNILVAKTAEKQKAKKEKIINNAKKLEKKAKNISSQNSQEEDEENEEEVTTEIVEETQIIEVNKPADVSKQSDFVIIDKPANIEKKEAENISIINQNPSQENSSPIPINNSNQAPLNQSSEPKKAVETENINIVEPSI